MTLRRSCALLAGCLLLLLPGLFSLYSAGLRRATQPRLHRPPPRRLAPRGAPPPVRVAALPSGETMLSLTRPSMTPIHQPAHWNERGSAIGTRPEPRAASQLFQAPGERRVHALGGADAVGGFGDGVEAQLVLDDVENDLQCRRDDADARRY